MKKFRMVQLFMLVFVLIIPTTSTFAASDSDYQRAVSAGEDLKKSLSKFTSYINSGNLYNVDSQYDAFTKKIQNTELLIGKVSGASKRNKLNATYVKQAKVAKERVIYEISQIRLLYKIDERFTLNQQSKAKDEYAKLNRLKKRAQEIKKAGGYASLPSSINRSLSWWDNYVVERLNANTSYELIPSNLDSIHDFLSYLNHVQINDGGKLLALEGWTMEENYRGEFSFYLTSFPTSTLEKLDQIHAKGNEQAVRVWAANIADAIDVFSVEHGKYWYAYAGATCQGFAPSSFPLDAILSYTGSCGYTFPIFDASYREEPSIFYDDYYEYNY
ncbi:hypothetical protein [Bacillus sp. AFS040349]|uniref:hypothetical protein n=1 Tax=Bacillus sp. AFS040349 TaxID=2033502 RepID=UPI000BFC7A92|nr:hypothetical protein [Bacillus sp. AFS040349]PGT80878.1 hypothetical protein COD11_19560 [Bacillus sp. AFS040349]